MKLDNEFTVGVPIEQAWAVLTDLELIAPCMPGAQLTGVTDGVYSGKVKIKVGPVTAEYSGTAQFSVKDETVYRAVIDARGRDSRGNGNATAVISAGLQSTGESTVVSVSTDLTIAGRIAQFGSGMIKEISAKLLGQFVTCLEGKLSAGAVGGPEVSSADTGGAANGTVGAAAGTAVTSAAPTGAAETQTAVTSSAAMSSAATSAAAMTSSGSASVASSANAAIPANAASPAGGPGQSAGLAGTATLPAVGVSPSGTEPAALDLMSVAGRAIFRRLVPLIIGLIVVGVVIYLIVR